MYSLAPEAYDNVVGVEAPLWSERVHNNADADNRMWPRLMGVAELGWSISDQRDWNSFSGRIEALAPLLGEQGIQYYPWYEEAN